MGYYIYASLENGAPHLTVVDADTQCTCLDWEYQSPQEESELNQKREIQSLFRELLLLTCKQEAKNTRLFALKPVETKN